MLRVVLNGRADQLIDLAVVSCVAVPAADRNPSNLIAVAPPCLETRFNRTSEFGASHCHQGVPSSHPDAVRCCCSGET